MPRPRRNTTRLPGWDYASEGWYFVTICTKDGRSVFGEITDEGMQLNQPGEIVAQSWEWLADQYPYVSLDEYVIMPNHLHGIIALHAGRKGGSRTAPTTRCKSLGRLIGAFKTVSTKRINQLNRSPGKILWKRGYYDHIIRNPHDLRRIRRYIRLNPTRWAIDPYHTPP